MTEQDLRRRIDYEQQLRKIVQRIRQSLDVAQILHRSAIEIRHLLQADRVVIYRMNGSEDAQFLQPAAAANSEDIAYTPALQKLHKDVLLSALGHIGSKGYAVVSDLERCNLHADLKRLWREAGIKSATIVSLGGDRLVGLVGVQQYTEVKVWQPFELEGLSHIAAEIAVAVHQAELYQQVQDLNAGLEAEVEKRTAQVRKAALFDSTLKRITDKVRDSLDEAQILQTAVRELALVLELGGCNAALYDLQQETSTIFYEYANLIPAYRGRVAQMSNFPEIYDQLRQQVYFQFCSLSPNPERGHASLLACPIFLDSGADSPQAEAAQEVLGDLWLVHHPNHVFNEFEIRLVQQVANQCAIAIRQARLYQAARSQVDELKKLNRMKDEFLSTVSHELRTPIANVRMALQMLKSTPLHEKRHKYLEILESESRREANLIDDLLDMQRLEAGSVPVRPRLIHLSSWVAQLIQPFRSRATSCQQTLTLRVHPQALEMTSDVDILQRILTELINNACKYTPADGQIELTCLAVPSPFEGDSPDVSDGLSDAVRFTVRNRAEIPRSELPHIFETFYRVPHADPWRQGGTGLGLALVKKLVSRLNGSIEADSYDGWTWFDVTLPYAIPTELP
ncbi:MAG: histidine kinase dimerization/phospho-acceptor domain-containing protein [Elainellaceae cyanobacterium]